MTVSDPSSVKLARTPVGLLGTAFAGFVEELGAEIADGPTLFTATTLNLYVVPLVKLDTVHDVAPLTVQLCPPGAAVTTYEVIGAPPLDDGAFQLTTLL